MVYKLAADVFLAAYLKGSSIEISPVEVYVTKEFTKKYANKE